MASRGSRALAVVIALLVLATACNASDDGTALLRNESRRGPLTVVVIDRQGHLTGDKTMVNTFIFDTQFVNRELQCLVAQDGHFEVRDSDGTVVVSHDFADRPVCERDVITLGPDGSLTWE